MSTFRLEIVTPDRKVFSDEVDFVLARGVEGDIGVLPHHMPLVTPLKISGVKIKQGDQVHHVAVSGGFLEVAPDSVSILAQSAELAEEIDLERAQRAKERAEDRLRQKARDDLDFQRAELALQRALNRINLKQGVAK